jgi:hypothetical protein
MVTRDPPNMGIMHTGMKMSVNTDHQAVIKGLLENYSRPESDRRRRNSEGWFG